MESVLLLVHNQQHVNRHDNYILYPTNTHVYDNDDIETIKKVKEIKFTFHIN